MPCDSVRTSTIDIGKMQPDLARLALEALGLANRVTYNNGILTAVGVRIDDTLRDKIKQSYAAEVVKATAKRYGWTTRQTAPFKYEIVKR
jgi:hypothetical protein